MTNRTEAQLLREAIQVQDACNLSGVVHSFSRAISDLWEIARAKEHGTEWVNTHPVSILYSDKIRHLSRSDEPLALIHAFDYQPLEEPAAAE